MNFSWIIEGKLAGCMGPVSHKDLLFLKEQGVGALVRMEQDTISSEEGGLNDLAEFVPDLEPPTDSQLDLMIAFVKEQISNEVPVAVSCKAGLGRTGTVLACYLLREGYSAGDAIERIRRLRPGSIESPGQRSFVHDFQGRLGKSTQ